MMNTSYIDNVKSIVLENSTEEVLRILSREYPDKVCFSTSFGLEDQAVSFLIHQSGASIRQFTLDTGRLFQETYDIMEQTKIAYSSTIETHFPERLEVEQMMNTKGPNSFYYSVENRKECCRIRKIEPLKKALRGMEIWITGLRAGQSQHRAELPKVEWDESNQIIKYHPILEWSDEQLNHFIKENKIPYNTLHDKGFPSIGCAPCTRAIEPGEDIRAGRWWWEASHKECGLHK